MKFNLSFFKLAFLAMMSFLFVGCVVTIVSGPSQVGIGETVVYELDISSDLGGSSDMTLSVVAEVPSDWVLASNSFIGVINGSPVSGSGTVVPGESCGFMFGMSRPEMQRIRIDAGPFPMALGSDTGTLALEFQAMNQPGGEFKVGFVFGGSSPEGGGLSCGRPAYRTINRNRGLLSFLGVLFDEVDVPTLAGSTSVQVSPDGQHVLSTAVFEDALNLFEKDPVTGDLTFLESHVDGVNGVDGLASPIHLEISPEGNHVFVASPGDDAIAVFELDGDTLTYLSAAFDNLVNPRDLAIRGRFIYAATETGVSVFERDLGTGDLAFVQILSWSPSVNASMNVVVSPDGHHVYVTTTGRTIRILSRDSETGQVSMEDLTSTSFEPSDLVVSPDGQYLYAIGGLDSRMSAYQRDPVGGSLSLVESWDRFDFGDFLFEPRALAMSSSGEILFLGSSQAISALGRLPQGRLKLLDFEVEGDSPVTGISDLSHIALSPEGNHLYATSSDSGSLATFVAGPAIVFADGFESGDTSAWYSTVP